MKTTKRVIAVVLAVMMLALMVPFAASAAAYDYNAEITAKEGYTVSVYRIADFDGADKYTAVSGVAADIKSAVEAVPAVPQNILNAAEAAKKAGQNTGVKEGADLVVGATGKVSFGTNTPGLYYATITGTPAGVNVKSTGGSIFYLADAKNASGASMKTATIDISGKIADGTVTVSKTVKNSDMGSDTQTTAKIGEEVTFVLTASVTGTKDEYLNEYVIHDAMASTLDYVRVASVKVDSTTLKATDDYTVDADDKTDIKIALTSTYLNAAKEGTNGFYNAANVVVELVGKLNNSAKIGRETNDDATAYDNTVANYNKDKLTYKNKYNVESEKTGNTVHVYSFRLPVEKVDATTNNKIDTATFQLTGINNYSETKNTSNGEVTFSGLKAGTYTLKETAAPDGYNINTTEYTVVISANGTVTVNGTTAAKVTVSDTPIVMPATGGQGTMIFTIIGISLIACAGVLFIILKKRASK